MGYTLALAVWVIAEYLYVRSTEGNIEKTSLMASLKPVPVQIPVQPLIYLGGQNKNKWNELIQHDLIMKNHHCAPVSVAAIATKPRVKFVSLATTSIQCIGIIWRRGKIE